MQLCLSYTNLPHRYQNSLQVQFCCCSWTLPHFSEDRFTYLFRQTHICVDDRGSNMVHLMSPTFTIQWPAKVSVNVVGWAAPQLNPGKICKGYTCTGMTFMERSSEENISCILTSTFRIRSHRFGKEHPGRPGGSCGNRRFQQKSLGAVGKGLFGEHLGIQQALGSRCSQWERPSDRGKRIQWRKSSGRSWKGF